MEILSPEDWFERAHDHDGYKSTSVSNQGWEMPVFKTGVFVWEPPPAAMQVALEQLRISRIKRQSSTHVVVCAKRMTQEWMRQLNRTADCLFSIKPGNSFWPANQHESLFVAICFPFLNRPPWQLRGTPKMLSVGRKLSSMLKEPEVDGRKFLRKLLLEVKRLPTMSPRMVRKLLYFQ